MPPPREVWVPFSLAELSTAESIPLRDPEEFIPYLTQKWPPSGRPHRVELRKGDRPNARGVDGWIVFRVPPPTPEESGKRTVTVDWSKLRPKIPPKKRKPQPEE